MEERSSLIQTQHNKQKRRKSYENCLIALFITLLVSTNVAFAATTNANRSLHLLGKMEANLWASAAAVYFHIADHACEYRMIALNDDKDDIETTDRILDAMESLKLTDKEKETNAMRKKELGECKNYGQ